MFEVGTKLIRIQTGQHYIIEKTKLSKVKGKFLKKEVLYHLKSEYDSSLDLIVHKDELKTLFMCVKQTNADRIRAMSDEELAEFLGEFATRTCHYCLECGISCNGERLKWLKAEAEGE